MWALIGGLMLAGCAAPDPGFRQALSEVKRQPESARVKLRPFAEQYHLGMFYKSGIGTPEDRTEALRWYKVAAERGHEAAENEARGLQGMARVCRNAITGCRMF